MVLTIKHTKEQSAQLQHLLQRIPVDVRKSFSEEQLSYLDEALNSRKTRHTLNVRGSIKLWRRRYYFVFLAGKNIRSLSRTEQRIGRFAMALTTSLFILFSLSVGLLCLYLLKSALGIDLLEGISLGVWDWFRS